jgi:pyruvate-ferredoxin/flavodoxin oxidoreductase
MKVQAYFQYDSRKSGGVTISHLRFGNSPIKSTYYISKADFVACHVPAYLETFDIVQDVKPGGVFLANTSWDVDELTARLPAAAKKYIADNNIRFYTCDAEKIARELGLGNKTNAILQSAFFKLSEILPIDDAVKYMKKAVSDTYSRKGEDVVNMNSKAIDKGLDSLVKIDVPAAWKTPGADKPAVAIETDRPELAKYYCTIAEAMNNMRGDKLPVSPSWTWTAALLSPPVPPPLKNGRSPLTCPAGSLKTAFSATVLVCLSALRHPSVRPGS